MSNNLFKNVLLISSDDKLNHVLTNYCAKYDVNITVTDSGSKGIQATREGTTFPVVIVTQILFDITGSKAVSIIKKHSSNSRFILITNKITNAEHSTFMKDGADYIFSTPLDISEILLNIQDAINSYTESAAEQNIIMQSPPISMKAEFHFTIRDISETGCLFRSPFPIERGSIIILESKEISDKLSIATNTIYPVRVMNCNPAENNKGYDLGGIFVGMQRKITGRLKQACISAKGFKFTATS